MHTRSPTQLDDSVIAYHEGSHMFESVYYLSWSSCSHLFTAAATDIVRVIFPYSTKSVRMSFS